MTWCVESSELQEDLLLSVNAVSHHAWSRMYLCDVLFAYTGFNLGKSSGICVVCTPKSLDETTKEQPIPFGNHGHSGTIDSTCSRTERYKIGIFQGFFLMENDIFLDKLDEVNSKRLKLIQLRILKRLMQLRTQDPLFAKIWNTFEQIEAKKDELSRLVPI